MEFFAVNNFGDTRSGGLAGPMGLFLIVLMCVATVLLIRNMNKRIRRLPDSFPVAAERDRVVDVSSAAPGAGKSVAGASAEVEANRSAPAVQAEEPEVAGVEDERGGSGSRGAAGRV